jgi:hypothetical protein
VCTDLPVTTLQIGCFGFIISLVTLREFIPVKSFLLTSHNGTAPDTLNRPIVSQYKQHGRARPNEALPLKTSPSYEQCVSPSNGHIL